MNTFRRRPLAVIAPFLLCLYCLNIAAQESPEEDIHRLIGDLNTQDELRYEAAIDSLEAIGLPAVPSLIKAFESDNFMVRRGVRDAVAGIGEPAVPALLEAMESGSPQVRSIAAEALVTSDLEDSFLYADAVHYALLKALSDPDQRVRVKAAKALWEMTDESASPNFKESDKREAALSALVKDLNDPERDVRASALQSLSTFVDIQPQFSLRDLVADLTTALDDESPHVRRIAAYTLGLIGEPAYASIPQLTQRLGDAEPIVRSAAAGAFADFGELAKDAIPQLESLLNDPDRIVRSDAAIALVQLGVISDRAVRELREALKYPDEDTREHAAFTLGLAGDSGEIAISELQEMLSDNYPEVRRAVTLALGRIGEPAGSAVSGLRAMLYDRDALVRTNAARALGRIGEAASSAVPDLQRALKDSSAAVRAHAARSLGQLGFEPAKSIPELSQLLNDPNQLARQFSAEAMAKMAVRLEEQEQGLTFNELGKGIATLELALQSLETAAATDKENADQYRNAIRTISLALTSLNTERYGIFYEFFENKLLVGIVAYLVLLPLFWWLLLWLRPLWLFKVNHALEPYEFAAPRALSEKNRFSTRYLLLAGFFYYHPRVLDAWVRTKLPTIRDSFQGKTTVESNRIRIPLPVTLDGETLTGLAASDLVPTFSRQPSCLLIRGEGGSGKTNLAIGIAHMAMAEDEKQCLSRHPMFPIMIDQEVAFDAGEGEKAKKKGPSPLVEIVRGQLQNLTHSPEPLSEGVVTALLKRPSILLIMTDLSERSDASREQIRPDLPDFPVNALAVTSRTEESLGQVMKTTLHPLRISAAQYPPFLEAYVTERSKTGLFGDGGYAETCQEFSRIVGRYQVPVLLARLHADSTIAAREAVTDTYELPGETMQSGDVLELIFSYLNEVNPGIDLESAYATARVVAWECLKASLRPQPVKRKDLLLALGEEDAAERLKYLQKPLSMIQAVAATGSRYRFTLELLAEYFAAMHLIETRGNDEASWREFLQQADGIPGAPAAVRDFLQALRNCCLIATRQVPGFLLDELSSRINAGSTPAG